MVHTLLINYSHKDLCAYSSFTLLFPELKKNSSTLFLLNFEGKQKDELEEQLSYRLNMLQHNGYDTFRLLWIFPSLRFFNEFEPLFNELISKKQEESVISHSFWVISKLKLRENPFRQYGGLFNACSINNITQPLGYSKLSYFLIYSMLEFINRKEIDGSTFSESYAAVGYDDKQRIVPIKVTEKKSFDSFLRRFKKQLSELNKEFSPHDEEVKLRLFKEDAPFFVPREKSDDKNDILMEFIGSADERVLKYLGEPESAIDDMNRFKNEFTVFIKNKYDSINREEGVLISNDLSNDSNEYTFEASFVTGADSVREQILREITRYKDRLKVLPDISVPTVPSLDYLIFFSNDVINKTRSGIDTELKKLPLWKNTLAAVIIGFSVLLVAVLPFLFKTLFIFPLLSSLILPAIVIAAGLFTHYRITKIIGKRIIRLLAEMINALEPVSNILKFEIKEDKKAELNKRAAFNKNFSILEGKLRKLNLKQEENRYQTNEIEELLEMVDLRTIEEFPEDVPDRSKSSLELFKSHINQ